MKPIIAIAALLSACAASRHAPTPAPFGTPRSTAELAALVDQPGLAEVETVSSSVWAVPRQDLINLEHPQARAAGLRKGLEPIEVYFHVIRHPTRGTFIVDTGVERALRDAPGRAAVRGSVAWYLNFGTMKIKEPLGDWLAAHPEPLRGVFLTHLHPDHISGLADAPAGTPVFVGAREAQSKLAHNMLLQPVNDRALAGKPLVEWQFARDPSGRFAGVLDVFGDGQVWALLVPGHTRGSVAFVVRTAKGPVLLTGDACHTRWGWEHGVEPGPLSDDIPASAVSLAALRAFAAEHPALEVRPGHQR